MGIAQEHPDEHYMRLAMAQAQLAEKSGEVPVGAVVVYQGEVIAQAYNQVITRNNPTAHAEILALEAAGQQLNNYRLKDCELYVTLEPCSMCAGSMVHARLSRVVFGAYDQKTGVACSVEEFFKKKFLNHQVTVQAGVLAKECGKLLSDFFSMRRKQKKSSHCE